MKCFECGVTCLTIYLDKNLIHVLPEGKIYAVSKECPVCQWQSHPIKIPEPI